MSRTMAYRINSLRCPCSTTSTGGVSKSSSSAMMREMRSSTLSATGAVSCRVVCKVISRRMPETYFVIGINGGDGPQDRLECTGSVRWILGVVHGSGVYLECCPPAISPWDWRLIQTRLEHCRVSNAHLQTSQTGQLHNRPSRRLMRTSGAYLSVAVQTFPGLCALEGCEPPLPGT